MVCTILASLVVQSSPGLEMSYDEFLGLQVSLEGVPIVVGSSFQYYEKGWRKGIYSSRWSPKKVDLLDSGSIRVIFSGKGALVAGKILYTPTDAGFKADYDFTWLGGEPVFIENSAAFLWAPLLDDGLAVGDGVVRSRMFSVPKESATISERTIAEDAEILALRAPYANVSFLTDEPMTVFDARNYTVDWANGKPVIWAGQTALEIKPGEHIMFSTEWRVTKNEMAVPAPRVSLRANSIEAAYVQVALDPMPLVPKPALVEYGEGFLPANGGFVFLTETGTEITWLDDLVEKYFRRQWLLPDMVSKVGVFVSSDDSLESGAYELTVNERGIKIVASNDESMRNAAMRLVQVVRSNTERLIVPYLTIKDSPKIAWRGLHMFVGPEALEFQSEMIDRLFVPLMFNKVVLQCERTAWSSQPGIKTSITTSKQDLASLFAKYREAKIEPIPLIQSLGHMDWLFENKQNLDIAVNPNEPYTIDPRKKRAQVALREIWEEAIDLLEPKMVHFGLDEIDMRGMKDDPHMATRLWEQQIPWLLDFAEEKEVEAMMWGDFMLAPEEAIDATHAPTQEIAEQRRAVLNKGTWIADWHYKPENDTKKYKALGLWNKLEMNTVASGWHEPENIADLTRAASKTAAGYLQTTWAGYESNAGNMMKNLEQFYAYVLAADYSWNPRDTAPELIGYHPSEIFRRLMFDTPQPIRPRKGLFLYPMGQSFPQKDRLSIGQFAFARSPMLTLNSVISKSQSQSPYIIEMKTSGIADKVALAVQCASWLNLGDEVATVTIETSNGYIFMKTLLYGIDVCAPEDSRDTVGARAQGISVVVIQLGDEQRLLTKILFERGHPAAGLRILGITVVP